MAGLEHKYGLYFTSGHSFFILLKIIFKLSEYKWNLMTVLWSRSTKSGSRLFADRTKTRQYCRKKYQEDNVVIISVYTYFEKHCPCLGMIDLKGEAFLDRTGYIGIKLEESQLFCYRFQYLTSAMCLHFLFPTLPPYVLRIDMLVPADGEIEWTSQRRRHQKLRASCITYSPHIPFTRKVYIGDL